MIQLEQKVHGRIPNCIENSPLIVIGHNCYGFQNSASTNFSLYFILC